MRPDIDNFREIADSLLRNRSRSLLTGFGIFWGLFMLLFLSGGGEGVKEMLKENFTGFAANTTVVFSGTTSKPYKGMKAGRKWDLEDNDVQRVRMMFPEVEVVTAVSSSWGQTAVYGINTKNCNIKGVYPEYAMIEAPQIKYGRYINDTDCLQERKVCVIGKEVYTGIFPEGGDPCGKYVKVGSTYYMVVGVDFNSGNISVQGSAQRAVVIPMTTHKKVYHRGKQIELLAMTGKKGVKMTGLEPRLRQVVGRQHCVDPEDKEAIGVLHTEQLFQIMDNLLDGVSFLIWLVGLGTIFAGAIGVSNIMMVTVKERTTEIGIRRAIGATPLQILSQILTESATLTLMAGSAGIVFSVLLLDLLGKIAGHNFQIGFWMAVVTMLLLAVLGAAAGLAPALRAMKIKPVDAMRDE